MPEPIEEIVAHLRVTSQIIKPFQYSDTPGEVEEVKAVGVWGEHNWPISLHITVYPGCGVIPIFGDDLQVTVTR
jgi:hypothetical protein